MLLQRGRSEKRGVQEKLGKIKNFYKLGPGFIIKKRLLKKALGKGKCLVIAKQDFRVEKKVAT